MIITIMVEIVQEFMITSTIATTATMKLIL